MTGDLVELGDVGIWSSELSHGDVGAAVEAVCELEELGYGAVWLPGGLGASVLDLAEPVLAATSRIVVTTAILSVWTVDAATVAERHARLRTHGGRFLLGLGVSHDSLVALSGQRYERPMATMRAYLDALDAASEPVAVEERFLAAQGPKMLALARERSRGAHPFIVTPDHTRVGREALGDGPMLAPGQKVVLDRDADRARAIGRQSLEIYLTLPNYTDNLLRLGFEPDDLAHGGSDRLVDGLVAWGDVDAVRARVQEHLDAGADHVAVEVLTGGSGGLASTAWRELAPA
jgi:probable F420-dependent oxidoreductase